MSHFTRIVEPLKAWVQATAEPVTLATDTEIKCVKIVDGSIFRFQASMDLGDVRAWVVLETEEDLPAFTDKGRAHRARHIHATLQPGRPLTGEEHVVRPIAFRPTAAQRAWLQRHADKRDVTLSELVRLGLTKLGMPR